MTRPLRCIALLAALVACTTPTRTAPAVQAPETPMHPSPRLRYRNDSFTVPEASRAAFDAAMRRNMAFIQTLPGFLGHTRYEQVEGPSVFNIVTVATWESPEAVENAVKEVRAYYQRIGFDPPVELARWGARAELGFFTAAPPAHAPAVR